MRHQVAKRKLGKKSAHRTAMFRNMSASLIEHGRINTTLHKAKELRTVADKLVTIGKENTLHARRKAFNFLRNRDAVQKLFNEVAPAFAKRNGGYTRIYQTVTRVGDAAKMAIIEYLNEDLLTAKVEGKIEDPKSKKKADKKKDAKKKEAKVKKEAKPKKTPKLAKETKKSVVKKAEPKQARKRQVQGTKGK